MSNITTFGGFTTARLGIYASQKAMEVTGNNIANINTVGYTRQVLQQKSLYVGGADHYASKSNIRVGSGVLCTGVSQLRDPYLDIRYRNEMSSVGAMDSKLSGLEQLSAILDEVGKGMDGEGVIEAQLNDLIEQMENLVTQGAGKDGYDTLVRSSAESLVSLFNTYADKLATLKSNQEMGLKEEIAEVNTILESIQALNESITKSQIHGGDALELKDQRNILIDKLSKYVRIDVTYTEEDLGSGTIVEKLVIKLAGGDPNSPSKNAVLVDGKYATRFSIAQVEDPANPDAMIDSPNFDLVLAALSDKNGRVLDGSGDVQLSDNDLYGSLQSSRELLTEKGEFSTQDDLDADPKAAIKRGIPYYQNMLDSLANKFATVLNEANTLDDSVIYDIDADGNKVLKPEYAGYNGGALFSNGNNGNDTTNITAANISISQDWSNGKVHMLQSREPHDVEQSTDNSNLVHLLFLMKSEQKYTPGDTLAGADSASRDTPFYNGSFQGMLGRISSTLANDTKTAKEILENHVTAADDLYVSRDSATGVDLNDEAVGMMQFQKSYSAACRLLTTLDEMIDKLINGTGRAGL